MTRVAQPTPRLAATVLIFEALVVVFAAVAARALTDLPTATVLGGGGALALLLAVASGGVRFRSGLVVGSVLQVAVVATAFVLPAMAILGLLFAGLWVAALVLGFRAAAQTPGPPVSD